MKDFELQGMESVIVKAKDMQKVIKQAIKDYNTRATEDPEMINNILTWVAFNFEDIIDIDLEEFDNAEELIEMLCKEAEKKMQEV